MLDRRRLVFALAAALAVAALASALGFRSGTPATTPAPAGALALQTAIVRLVHDVSPSVVQIESASGLGSGVVFDGRGNVVTNAHVVQGARSFTVTTSTGKRYQARLVGTFPPDDLAVIRVSAGLTPAKFGTSRLRVGDIVIAIGNPLGLRSSVTEGIVSAFRQGVPEGNGVSLPSVIQTSAPINPGNSGGALVDLAGRVVGIPTLAAADPRLGGAAPGIGFAIPSSVVRDIAGQIVRNGKVVNSRRAYLGIQVADTGGQGVYVAQLEANGPAAAAGIRVGDVIVSVAGRRTPTTNELSAALSTKEPGRTVGVVVQRQDGSRSTVDVKLGQFPG